MGKYAFKTGKSRQDVGKAILAAWQKAIDEGKTEIDRDALVAALNGIIDKTNKGGTDRTIEIDLVFDTDLDATTRLVWLAIPTPDVDKPGGDDTWAKFKKKKYDDLSTGQKTQFENDLGEAVLFGCGR